MKDEDRYQEIYDLEKNNQYQQAKQKIDEWLEEQPQNTKAWSTLVHYHIYTEEYDKAEKACLKSIELEPQEPAFYFNLGRIKVKKDEIENAAIAFKKAKDISIEIDKIYYLRSSQFSYAYCCYLIGKKDIAKEELKNLPDDLGLWIDQYIDVKELKQKLEQV